MRNLGYSNIEVIDTYKLLNAVIYRSDATILESRNTFYYRALMYSSVDASFDDFLEQLDSVFKTSMVESILGFIFDKSHAAEYLRQKKQYQAVANLMKLKDKAKELTQSEMIKPLQFLEYLDIMITSGKDEDEAEISEDDRRNGVVSIYSIHKAKGLEFPIVIVPNCDLALSRKAVLPKIIYDPHRPAIAVHKSILDKESKIEDKDYAALFHGRFKLNLEEELRIFYVACTRAKNMLVLSCKGSRAQVQQNSNTSVSWIGWVLNSNIF